MASELEVGDVKATNKVVVTKNQQTTVGTPFSGAAIKVLPSNTTNTTGVSSLALSTSTVDNYGYLISGHRAGSDGGPSLRISSHSSSDTGTEVLTISSTGAVSIPSAAGTQVALTVKGGNNLVDNIAINLTNQAGDTGTNIRNNGQLFASTLATFSGGINLGDDNLSNYKEGTWTPALSKGSESITSPGVATGRYVRIGKSLFVSFYYFKGSAPTTTVADAWDITGLPFNCVTGQAYQSVSCGYVVIQSTSYQFTSPYRWQLSSSTATKLSLFGAERATNNTGGNVEFSGFGVLEIA